METYHIGFSIAALVTRLFLGIIFVSQGYSRLFKVGSKHVADFFGEQLAGKNYPKWILSFSAYATSISECIGGILLILGLFRGIALSLLSIDILLVTLAFSVMQTIVDLEHIFPRLLLLLVLWLIPSSVDIYTLDELLKYVFNIDTMIF
ncbi:DoxX family membrane protein [Solitalea canadensis]|uniref:DoxX protein n=1 Tax=Solitalea canadensis (strain ATCC 29591 / DSM 3403 / JCM 21819 / LMG 8368 / NBRC 15130 / NCIMB 12057 / USAM 9D) TaxID=929556 RepID=H8KQD8_SOLCM|nr:DoxX family membrane protein [Solitalea canadensis]AFD06554.1 DoxX protein [Solitalea canadensis DSM 3403]